MITISCILKTAVRKTLVGTNTQKTPKSTYPDPMALPSIYHVLIRFPNRHHSEALYYKCLVESRRISNRGTLHERIIAIPTPRLDLLCALHDWSLAVRFV